MNTYMVRDVELKALDPVKDANQLKTKINEMMKIKKIFFDSGCNIQVIDM
jgi:hypothetical protein